MSAEAAGIPSFDHVVVVVMENHGYSSIIGNADAPYVNALAVQGASFTQSFAVTHPSQPNYLAMYSGSTQGATTNTCPLDFVGVANLGGQLIAAGKTFVGYSEDMPAAGYIGCSAGLYVRKHNPWVDFDDVPAGSNQPYGAFPVDYAALPDVAFVVPNQCNNTHDCAIAVGDSWLQAHFDAYAQWAKIHNSLLILTWDEDGGSEGNRIVTLFVGDHVRAGTVCRIDRALSDAGHVASHAWIACRRRRRRAGSDNRCLERTDLRRRIRWRVPALTRFISNSKFQSIMARAR